MGLIISAVILCAITAYFGWVGYTKGALLAVRGMLSSLAGYLFAYSFAGDVGAYLSTHFHLSQLVAVLVASAVIFFLAVVITTLLITQVRQVLVILREGDEDHDLRLGVIVGGGAGLFAGLVVVWLAGVVLDAISLVKPVVAQTIPRSSDPVRTVAGEMVGGIVSYAVGQKSGKDTLAPQMAGELIADPVAVSQQLVTLSHSEEIHFLFTDPAMQELLAQSRDEELMVQPAFQKLMQQPEASSLLNTMGNSFFGQKSQAEQERQAAHLLSYMWQRGEAVRTDPRFAAIMEKPETREMLAHPNPLAWMTNPDLQTLASIAFEASPTTNQLQPSQLQSYTPVTKAQWEPADPGSGTAAGGSAATETTQQNDHVIYRWTDDQGMKHISNTKPDVPYPLEVMAVP